MGLEAATKALLDAGTARLFNKHIDTRPNVLAGITYDAVQAAYVGYCYGDSTAGQVNNIITNACSSLPFSQTCQRALYQLGMTGIPVTNVNNNCSTGSTALYNANLLVKSGLYDCVLALGFERMARGGLGTNFPDREPPTKVLGDLSTALEPTLSAGVNHGPGAPRMFANGSQEYFDKFGGSVNHLAQIGGCELFCAPPPG